MLTPKQIADQPASAKFEVHEVGTVESVKKFIVIARGLPSFINGQIVVFQRGMKGIVMGFKEDKVQILVLGSAASIRNGDEIYNRGEPLCLPVGEKFIGRIVSGICEPADGKDPIVPDTFCPVFRDAAGLMDRVPVEKTLETGTVCIDAGIPIALGQRQLLIGDRLTGKTTVAMDAILNQKKTGLICIYCCIGKPYVSLLKTLHLLNEHEAMSYTVVVSAVSSTPVAEQYLAPYTACMLGEHFMYQGRDVLVVFDDITKHAWVYRQISLLLERAPGREAYPGDVFYLHSRLLERAAKLNDENGSGSLTALPIIETQAGDVSAYIPTNVISITDGQIYLESDLFHSGIRPAVNTGLSVSRVGGNAQIKAMRQVAGSLRLNMAQFRALAAFAQFGSDLDKATLSQLNRGQRLTEVLKQDQYVPLPVEKQVVIIFAGTNGLLDDLEVAECRPFEEYLYRFLDTSHTGLLQKIRERKAIDDEMRAEVNNVIKEAKERFKNERSRAT